MSGKSPLTTLRVRLSAGQSTHPERDSLRNAHLKVRLVIGFWASLALTIWAAKEFLG